MPHPLTSVTLAHAPDHPDRHYRSNTARTTADRALFQNQQESVDRFGSLLRNYQGSKKGLQQYPERALQDLRSAR